MPDYNRAVKTAQRLIADAGREISLQGVSPGPADANNPLAGPKPVPDAITGVRGVFVGSSGLGTSAAIQELFKSSTEIALVAGDGIHDFATMKFLIDSDGSQWKINTVQTLKPAGTIILYYIGVSRP